MCSKPLRPPLVNDRFDRPPCLVVPCCPPSPWGAFSCCLYVLVAVSVLSLPCNMPEIRFLSLSPSLPLSQMF